MELIDLIRAAGRTAWLMLILPLATAVLAGGYQLVQSTDYSATATITLPSAGTGRNNAQFARDFTGALNAESVVAATAKATGVPRSDVGAGLAGRPTQEGSSVLQVTWTGPSRDADKVATVAAKQAFTFLARPRLQTLTAQEKAVADLQTSAAAKRAAYLKEAGVADPAQALDAARSTLTRAKASLGKATSASAKKAEQTKVDAAQKEVDRITPVADSYKSLSTQVDRAADQLATARKETAEAKAQLAAVEQSEGAVVAGAPTAMSSSRALARAVAGGGVVGLIAAIVILLALQSTASGRQARRPAPERSTPRRSGGQDIGYRSGRTGGARSQPVGRRTGRRADPVDPDDLPRIVDDGERAPSWY